MAQSSRRLGASRLRAALAYWVLIPGVVLGSGWLVDRALGLAPLPGAVPRVAAGAALVLGGVLLVAWATRDFRTQGRGTPNPLDPPRRLVTSGAYRLCRNPMFLGYDLAGLGVILVLGSRASLFLSFPCLLVLEAGFLRREEARLRKRFGEEYSVYRRSTPFLLPRPRRDR